MTKDELEAIKARANEICGLPLDCLTEERWRAVQTAVFALIEAVEHPGADAAVSAYFADMSRQAAENTQRITAIRERVEARRQRLQAATRGPRARFKL